MRVRFCPYCGNSIHGSMRFCPGCGESLERLFPRAHGKGRTGDFKADLQGFMESFIENNADLLKDLAAKFETGEPFEKGMFFAVEMKGDKHIIKSGDIKDLEKMLKETPFYHIFHQMANDQKSGKIEFREARAEVTESRAGRTVTINLPGVSSMKDVMINRIDDGLEIAARGDGGIYFSKVNLGRDFKIKNSLLDGGVLTIEVT